jgi:MFS family permease
MSQGYASPSSLRLELEARRMHAAAPPRGLGDLAPAVALSGFPQAFDVVLGAAAAVLVFPQVLFPTLAPTAAVAAGLAVWSLAYAVAPFGAALFQAVSRRYGAGVRLTAARCLLGGSMAAVGFLPIVPGAAGIALLLLGMCRLAHGLALGGVANEGAAVRAFGRAPHGRLWTGLIRLVAVALALVAAAAIDGILVGSLSRADFLDWGWRYPFLMGVPANIVALFAHLRLFTTDPEQPRMRLA